MDMNIFKVAKEMELVGKKSYEDQLAKTTSPGLKKILQIFIKEEENHYQLFDEMEKDAHPDTKEVIVMDFKEMKSIFENIKDTEGLTDSPDDQIMFYKKAKEVEVDAEAKYREFAESIEDERLKEVILKIADEEHRHAVLIQNIITLIKRPNEWVEDAEFNQMEEY